MKYTPDPRKPSIVFAFYDMDNNFIGFRQDTFGTIGKDYAKIYHYSESQVKTVLDNISGITKGVWEEAAHKLSEISDFSFGKELQEHAKKNADMLRDYKAFRVKIIPCPDFDNEWNYPNMDMFMLTHTSVQPIKTYKFTS
jgi:hypothetical protein